MSVILDALKKAQEERKKPSYRNAGDAENSSPKTKWILFAGIGAALCCLVLGFVFFSNLYRSRPPSTFKPADRKPEAAAPQVMPPQVMPPQANPPVVAEKPEPTPKDEISTTTAQAPKAEKRQRLRNEPARAGSVRTARAEAAPQRQAPSQRTEKGEEQQKEKPPQAGPDVVVQKMGRDKATLYYNDALKEAELGRTDEAKRLYAAALAERPNNIEALNNLGVLAMKEGDSKGALSYFRKILEYRKDYPKAYNNIGILLMKEGQKELAEEYFRKAIEVNGSGVEPYLNLSALLRSEKRFADASQLFDALFKRGYRTPEAYLSYGIIKDEMGQYEEAIKYYRSYLRDAGQKEEKKRVIERLRVLEDTESGKNR